MDDNQKKLPPINSRIKQVIDKYALGNVANFSRMIDVGHQNINRIFNIDSRSAKYPQPSSQILNSIKIKLPQVDYVWLLTGHGSMIGNTEDKNDAQEINDDIQEINSGNFRYTQNSVMIPRELWEILMLQLRNLPENQQIILSQQRVIEILSEKIPKTPDIAEGANAVPARKLA
jgi:hypothetical protein